MSWIKWVLIPLAIVLLLAGLYASYYFYSDKRDAEFNSCVEQLEKSLIDNVAIVNGVPWDQAFAYIKNSNVTQQILDRGEE